MPGASRASSRRSLRKANADVKLHAIDLEQAEDVEATSVLHREAPLLRGREQDSVTRKEAPLITISAEFNTRLHCLKLGKSRVLKQPRVIETVAVTSSRPSNAHACKDPAVLRLSLWSD